MHQAVDTGPKNFIDLWQPAQLAQTGISLLDSLKIGAERFGFAVFLRWRQEVLFGTKNRPERLGGKLEPRFFLILRRQQIRRQQVLD